MDLELQYLHGFNSAALDSDAKVVALRQRFRVRLINYDSFAARDRIIDQIQAQMTTAGPTAFIGTSLGGYFSATMGRLLSRPAIIINPSCDPHWALAHYLGLPLRNHKLPQDEARELPLASVESYAGEALPTDPAAYPIAPRLLLDLGDELLDSAATLNTYGVFMQPLTFEGGSHRFEHMSEALDNIETYLQQHLT